MKQFPEKGLHAQEASSLVLVSLQWLVTAGLSERGDRRENDYQDLHQVTIRMTPCLPILTLCGGHYKHVCRKEGNISWYRGCFSASRYQPKQTNTNQNPVSRLPQKVDQHGSRCAQPASAAAALQSMLVDTPDCVHRRLLMTCGEQEHNIKANLSSKELIALLQTHLASKCVPCSYRIILRITELFLCASQISTLSCS